MNNKLDGISDYEMYKEIEYRLTNNKNSNERLVDMTNDEMVMEMNYRYGRKQYFDDKFFIVFTYVMDVVCNIKNEVLQNNKYNLDDTLDEIHNILFNNVKKDITFVLQNINNDIDLTNSKFYKYMRDDYYSRHVKPEEVEGIIKKVINNIIKNEYFKYDDIDICINSFYKDTKKLLKKTIKKRILAKYSL